MNVKSPYILISLLLISPVFTYTLTGSQLTDLETTTLSTELAAWGNPPTSTCNGTYLVGGYNVFGPNSAATRIYSSLPPHNMIYFTIELWRIDTWDSTDYVELLLDSVSYKFYSESYGIATQNLCGDPTFEEWGPFQAVIHQNHNVSSLTVIMKNKMDQSPTDESIGFRNIKILFVLSSYPQSNSVWAVGNHLPDNTAAPSCPQGYYYNTSTTLCHLCDDSCKNCTGGTNQDCVLCNPIGYFRNNGKCLSCDSSCYTCNGSSMYNCTNCTNSKFLFPNNQCLSDCPVSPTHGPILRCNYSCQVGYYLYPNSTCSPSSCIAGFAALNASASGGICNFTCGSNYYYENGSCIQDCAFPFLSYQLYGKNFCRFKCDPGFYLFENATCMQSCNNVDFIPMAQGMETYCNFKCMNGEYFYTNGTCSSCSFPFKNSSNSLGKYCDFVCENGFYLYNDSFCRSDCDALGFSIHTQGLETYCNFQCNSDQYLMQNGTCFTSCPVNFYSYSYLTGNYCNFSCPGSLYLYSNSSCLEDCYDPGFTPLYSSIEKYCNFECPQDHYYYQNGSCMIDCPSPFVQNNISVSAYCDFPCPANMYFMKNGTCSISCPSPFIIRDVSVGKYCDFPCRSDEFFYLNNSCLQTCNNPFNIRQVGVEQYCNFPCKQNEFLYQNSTCSSQCELPFISENISVGSYCNFKCRKDQFLFLDNLCSNNCSHPFLSYTLYDNKYCKFQCPNKQYLHTEDNSCRVFCKPPKKAVSVLDTDHNLCTGSSKEQPTTTSPVVEKVTSTTTTVISTTISTTAALIPFGFDPFTAAAILAIMQNFYFTLFYNVEYPQVVNDVLGTFGVSLFNFLPNPVKWLADPIPDLSSPKNFYVNNFTGFFLNTAFQCIVMVTAVYTGLIISLLCKFLRRPFILVRLGKKLAEFLDRSFRIRFILSIYSQTFLAALLQIMIFDSSRIASIVSYIAAIGAILICLGFPIFVYKILSKKDNSYAKLRLYDALIEDYDINHPEIRMFGFYVIFKRTVHCLALVFLYYYPLLQCILPWMTNIVMIVLMIRYKPHNRLGLNAYDLITEIGFFGVHSSVLALAYDATLDTQNENSRNIAGYLLLGSIGFVFLFTFYNVWRENIEIIKRILKTIKTLIRSRVKKAENSLEEIFRDERIHRRMIKRKVKYSNKNYT